MTQRTPPRTRHAFERRAGLLGAIIVLTAASTASTADAQRPKHGPKKPPVEEPKPGAEDAKKPADLAQELKLKGDAAFDAREFDTAAKAYEGAYEASKDPTLLYNQGRAYQAMARFPEALDRVEKFSAEATPALKARVPKLDELVKQLREKVAILVVNCNAESARVIVDKQIVGDVARTGSFRVSAAKSHVEIASEGYLPFARDLELRGASTTVLDVKLLSKTEAGILLVKSNTIGANVSVDGTPSGQAPTELVLLAGAHKITLAREGFDPTTSSSVVEPGKTKELFVPLEKQAGLLEKWWFWTAAGVVAVGATVLVIAAVTEKDPPSGTLQPGTTSAPLLRF